MKPRLRGGRAIGQRSPVQLPQKTYICRCPKCVQEWAWDPLTNALIRGRTCGWKEYDSHKRSAALAMFRIPDDSSIGEVPPSAPNATHTKEIAPTSPLPLPSTQGPKSYQRVRSVADASVIHVLRDLCNDCVYRRQTLVSVTTSALVFVTPPSPELPKSTATTNTEVTQFNTGHYALDPFCEPNQAILDHEKWLLRSIIQVESVSDIGRPVVRQKKATTLVMLRSELSALGDIKAREWDRRLADQLRARKMFKKSEVAVIDTSSYLAPILAARDPVVFMVYLVTAVLHILCHVSMDHCNWLLHGIRAILLLFTRIACASTTIPDVPIDIRTVVEGLDLHPSIKSFCCCPKCFFCYDLEDFPDRCTAQVSPGASPCGRQLRKHVYRGGKSRTIPARQYLYHDMKMWLGRFLCRPEIEEHLDRDVFDISARAWQDIWDGKVLRDFKGPDGAPFVAGQAGHEGRYLFGLNMDGFSPFGNKAGGSPSSCGAIYMVCLNLPPHLRYLPENTFLVAIIPGPHHPALTEINHLLRPLVTDLLAFWTHGVWYSQTFKYPQGRLVRCAIIPVICDLPAARQMMAFVSHTSKHFCCYCGLDKHHIDELDPRAWPSGIQEREEYVRIAEQWRDASKEERTRIFNEFGIRYSELLRLPYWDPTKFVVIDSMHAILLTILRHHCQVLWAMNINAEDGDGLRQYKKRIRKPTEEQMLKAWELMERGDSEDIGALTFMVIKQLCEEIHIPTGGKKPALLKQLLQYRRDRGWVGADDKPVHPLPKRSKAKGKDPVTEEERAEAIRYMTDTCSSQTTLAKRYRKEVLKDLHSRHVMVSGSVDVNLENLTREQLASELFEARSTYRDIVADTFYMSQPGMEQFSTTDKPTAVIGELVLREVHADMERTVLPSWLGRVPGNLGGSHRSLSADQWRTACTINFVVTLIRLWGSLADGDRHRKMLNNFMDLITATKAAHMRSLTPERIATYEFHMTQYLKTMQAIYPTFSILPYHHIALHLPMFLRNFGPVHGWRCFPFERYNHMLQQVPTNNKFGDMEATMIKTFCQGQNLRILIAGLKLPTALNFLKTSFMKTFMGDSRGTLLNDISAMEGGPVDFHKSSGMATFSEAIYDQLYSKLSNAGILIQRPRTVLRQSLAVHPKITARGVSYTAASYSQGDSLIILGDLAAASWSAGRISDIFVWTIKASRSLPERKIPFFVVHLYRKLNEQDAQNDPYRNWPSWVSGKLFYDEFVEVPVLLTLDDIVCHFAGTSFGCTSIESDCIHALPLDRD